MRNVEVKLFIGYIMRNVEVQLFVGYVMRNVEVNEKRLSKIIRRLRNEKRFK